MENNPECKEESNTIESSQITEATTVEPCVIESDLNQSEQEAIHPLTINDTNIKKEEVKEAPKKKKGKNFDINDYISMVHIGSGNFSEITMVEHKETKILYSLKSFQRQRVEQLHKEEDVLIEKHVMEKIIPHKNLIGYYGSTKDDFTMYILYEYINGGDLWKRCIVYGLPCEQLAKFYFIQLLIGIKHMHSFNVPHRDIKPENILITKDEMTLKIIDFGSSTDLDGTEFNKHFEAERNKQKKKKPFYKYFVGTPNFMGPECVHNQFADKRSDYWSLGCVLYNLLTGFPPFLGASEYLIFQKSIEAKYIFPEGIISNLAEDLIRKLIVIDADERLNIDQIMDHPYLKEECCNEEFLKILPTMTIDEKEYYDIRMKLYNKYHKYKEHAEKLDMIKKHVEMEEDLKRSEVTPEPNENDALMKELVSQKDIIQLEYSNALQEMIVEINQYKKKEEEIENKQIEQSIIEQANNNIISTATITTPKEMSLNHRFNCKLNFLEIQLKHDIFNIIYRGYEPPQKSEDS